MKSPVDRGFFVLYNRLLTIFKKMKNKHIRLIIFLASIALAGVLINQGFWINKEILVQKKQIEIQKKNVLLEKNQFENLVTLSLVNVRDKLISLNDELTELYLEPVQQITPNYFVVSFYDTLNPIILENLIVEQFKQYNVHQKFEYGRTLLHAVLARLVDDLLSPFSLSLYTSLRLLVC